MVFPFYPCFPVIFFALFLSFHFFTVAVDLKNPTTIVWIIEDRFCIETHNPEEAKRHLQRVIIGREIAKGPRHLLSKYELRKRPFIGTTSMMPILSFLSFDKSPSILFPSFIFILLYFFFYFCVFFSLPLYSELIKRW